MKNKQELDLIDRDWLSAECVRAILDPQEALDFLLARIKNAKPIDAVPVVRCRECKESEQFSVLDTDCLYCGVWDTTVHCNGYCYHGARMDAKEE